MSDSGFARLVIVVNLVTFFGGQLAGYSTGNAIIWFISLFFLYGAMDAEEYHGQVRSSR